MLRNSCRDKLSTATRVMCVVLFVNVPHRRKRLHHHLNNYLCLHHHHHHHHHL
jgi:hypothetical protein